MCPPETVPASLSHLTPELVTLLKKHAEGVLANLINKNSSTIFFRETPLLSSLRATLEHGSSDSTVCTTSQNISIENFARTVPLSTYEDYKPFVSRFLQAPRYSSNVSNLFAPGLPTFVVGSSGTSGNPSKYFLRYRYPTNVGSLKSLLSPTVTGGPYCSIFGLKTSEMLDVLENDVEGDNTVVKRIPFSLSTSAGIRWMMGWDAENDSALMSAKVPGTTSPLAACFISQHRTFVLVQALFALEDRLLEEIRTFFNTMIFDVFYFLEEYWDLLIQAIEDGQLPDLEGIEHVRHHLQAYLKPNPARAAELRAVGRDKSTPGRAKRLWPNLKRIMANSSGRYIRLIPQICHYIGPTVTLESVYFGSSESRIAYVYDPKHDLNLYKVLPDDLFEYLDVTMPEVPENVKRSWEIESGKTYEIVLTTQDGLWRYRLGDIIEIAGFDPVDGQPIIRYSERRHLVLRAAGEFTTENELRDIVDSLNGILGTVIEFTTIIDDRAPRAYGFLVELEGNQSAAASTSPTIIHDWLITNNSSYAKVALHGIVQRPTVRLLAPGTFTLYREWKSQKMGISGMQVKVPAVIYDPAVKDWLLSHVIAEL